MERPLIIYHADCADGFTAAWVAHRYFIKNHGVAPELRRGVYGQGAVQPADVEGRDVYFLDFSYKREHIEALAKAAKTLTILDHHESAWKQWGEIAPEGSGKEALEVIEGNFHAYFRRDQSGAMVAWMHFNPNMSGTSGIDMRALELVRYVEDRDLWRFDLAHSRAINAWIFSHEYTLAQWDMLAAKLEFHASKAEAVLEGEAIERKHIKDIKEFVGLATTDMVIGGRLVPTVNVPFHWGSDAGHILLELYPAAAFAATWYERGDGRRVFGLRSRKGEINVAEIARGYNGGGHPNAAGFDRPKGWEGDR